MSKSLSSWLGQTPTEIIQVSIQEEEGLSPAGSGEGVLSEHLVWMHLLSRAIFSTISQLKRLDVFQSRHSLFYSPEGTNLQSSAWKRKGQPSSYSGWVSRLGVLNTS